MTNTNVQINKQLNLCKFLDNAIMFNNYDGYKSYYIDKYNDKNCALLENTFLGDNYSYTNSFNGSHFTPYYNVKGKRKNISRIETFDTNNKFMNTIVAVIAVIIIIVFIYYSSK